MKHIQYTFYIYIIHIRDVSFPEAFGGGGWYDELGGGVRSAEP